MLNIVSKEVVIKLASFVLFWAAILHFLNFVLGGVITVYGFAIPVYFSLVISIILGYLGYKVRRLNADFF